MVRDVIVAALTVAWLGSGAEAAPPFKVQSVAPSDLGAGADTLVVVTGQSLCSAPSLGWSGSGVDTLGVTFVAPTRWNVSLHIDADAPTGPRDLFARCGGTTASLGAAITISSTPPPPPPPPPVQGFTADEKASLLHLNQAMTHLLGALSDYTASVTSTYTDGANHVQVGQGTVDTAFAIHHLNSALSGLLGAITEVHGTPEFEALAASSRSNQVANAHQHLDHAIDFAQRAITHWQAARLLNPDPVYRDAVQRIITPLTWAIGEMQAHDRSLAYLNFYPTAATPNGFHTLVGPHGDYDGAMWKLWRSVVYFTRAIEDVGSAVRLGSPTGAYGNMGRPYLQLAQANRNSVAAQMMFAGIPPATKDRFFTVLDGLRALTVDAFPGTPLMLHFLSVEWQTTFFPLFGQNSSWDALISDAVMISHDAWKHSDGAAWQSMLFPDCSILNNPVGCGGT